ncbi:MAG: hypothetical protein NT027_03635 [Proteobacteria bacterium]|nr:hypothetical protein [Pseudomonadota bacterium]
MSKWGLIDLKDEVLVSPLPKECYEVNAGGRILRLHQVVVREEMSTTRSIVFNYSATEISQISSDPMQLSFLMIHEWLWSHADNADVVRNINWFLRTKEMQSLSATDLVYALSNMGFKFKTKPEKEPSAMIVIGSSGVSEPNGRPGFSLPETVFIGSNTDTLNFFNSGSEKYFRIRLEDDSLTELCVVQAFCELKVSELPILPLTIWVERLQLHCSLN